MTLPQKPKSWKQFILAEEGETGDYPELDETLRDLRKYFKDLAVELKKRIDIIETKYCVESPSCAGLLDCKLCLECSLTKGLIISKEILESLK